LIYFGLVFFSVRGLEPFCIPSKHLVANKPFVYWIRFEKLFLVSFLLVFVNWSWGLGSCRYEKYLYSYGTLGDFQAGNFIGNYYCAFLV